MCFCLWHSKEHLFKRLQAAHVSLTAEPWQLVLDHCLRAVVVAVTPPWGTILPHQVWDYSFGYAYKTGP